VGASPEDTCTAHAGVRFQLLGRPSLPDARFADEHNHGTATDERFVKGVVESLKLAFASDEHAASQAFKRVGIGV